MLTGGGKELNLPLDALRALPSESVDVAFLTSRGEEKARYTGAKLWDILAGNGLIDPADHPALLRSLVIVTAGDGYALMLSAGELAPELGDAPVLLAHARDDQSIAPARSPASSCPATGAARAA